MRKLPLAVAGGLFLAMLGATLFALTAQSSPIVSQRTIGNMTMKATPPTLRTGGTAVLTLSVSGPAQYDACRPLRLWATNGANQRAWTQVQFWMCPVYRGPASIPAGKTQSFSFDWQTRGLAPGVYTIHGWFGQTPSSSVENIPAVSVEITS